VQEPAPVRLLIPYTKATARLQLIIDCLRIQYVQPELVKVGDGDEYHTMLREAWDAGETFYVVEQDVAVWQGAIRQLNECAETWCTLPTMCHGRMITTTFGCVKFGATLIERNPHFFDDVATTWFHLDAGFADKMGWPYIKPHAHWPPATHLNEVQWADDISQRYTLERKLVWQSMEAGQTVAKIQYRTTGDKRPHLLDRKDGDHVAAANIVSEG
jgi:hypothetical protein